MTAGRGAGITLAGLGRCGNFQAEGGIDRKNFCLRQQLVAL
jgi:hypothetical protein